jgi:hypothetical protein
VVNTSTAASTVTLDVSTCGSFAAGVALFSDGGTGTGQQPQPAPTVNDGLVTVQLAPWSISVLQGGRP